MKKNMRPNVMVFVIGLFMCSVYVGTMKATLEQTAVLVRTVQSATKALYKAMQHRKFNLAKSFLKRGADLNVQWDGAAWTFLHIAAHKGDLKQVKFLVESGAQTNIVDVWNRTPLHLASAEGHYKVVEYLINHSPSLLSGYGELMPLGLAKNNSQVSALLKKALNRVCEGALIEEENLEKAKLAIVNGADEKLFRNVITKTTVELNNALFRAAAAGDLEIFKEAIQRGADIKTRDANGASVLHVASFFGRTKLVAYILDQNELYINTQNKKGQTAVHVASMSGKLDVIKLLIKNGAQAGLYDLKDKKGRTPLHYAAKNGCTTVVEYFFEQNPADLLLEDLKHETALSLAVSSGRLGVVDYVASAQPDIANTPCFGGLPPLFVAIRSGDLNMVTLLLQKGANLNAIGYTLPSPYQKLSDEPIFQDIPMTPIREAIRCGNLPLVQYLFSCPDVDTTGCVAGAVLLNQVSIFKFLKGVAAANEMLFDGAFEGDVYKVRQALEEGANPNGIWQQWTGYTPLHIAAKNGYLEIVKELLVHGALGLSNACGGSTPLHLTVESSGGMAVIEELLKNGADVNAKDENKKTPLHLAAENGNVEAIKLLMQHHANVHEVTCYNQTCVFLAVYDWPRASDRSEVLKIFLDAGVDPNVKDKYQKQTALHHVKTLAEAQLLIAYGAENSEKDTEDKTAFDYAVEVGKDLDLIEFLAGGRTVDLKSDPILAGKLLRNAGNSFTIKRLIERGADIDALYDGRTTLQRHLYGLYLDNCYASISFLEIVCLFLKHHANVNVKDSKYQNATPLHYAAGSGNYELTKLLLKYGAHKDAKTIEGETPLDWAKKGKHLLMADLLNREELDL